MISLIVSIIALGVIITIHEFGHFIAARLCGVGVIEFSIGMGPRLCSRVIGNVRYSLRVFPFGGSCMMLGEEDEETEDEFDDEPSDAAKTRARRAAELTNASFNSDEVTVSADGITVDGRFYPREQQFVNKPAWKRFIIIFAGPAFNFILAFLLSAVICGWYGFDRPTVMEVDAGMPVAEAGIEPEDEIYALKTGRDRMSIECSRDISIFMYIHADEMNAAQSFTMYYRDASDGMVKKEAVLTPVYDEEGGRYRLGFAYNVAYTETNGIIDTALCSIYNVKYCIRASIESIKMIFRGQVTRQDVMGPVRMVAVMDESVDQAASYGAKSAVLTLLDLMILISGSLGCMNLMPLPALDGGRLVFIIIEMIIRRPVPKEFESKIHMAGMLLLLGLMVLIMANDITMLIFGS